MLLRPMTTACLPAIGMPEGDVSYHKQISGSVQDVWERMVLYSMAWHGMVCFFYHNKDYNEQIAYLSIKATSQT